MNCRKFLQFEFMRPARLVYEGPGGEAPSGGAERADKPTAAPVDPTGEPSATAKRRGAEAAKAVARGDEAATAEREAADRMAASLAAGNAETAIPAPAPAEGASPAEGAKGPVETAPPAEAPPAEEADPAPSGDISEKHVAEILGKPESELTDSEREIAAWAKKPIGEAGRRAAFNKTLQILRPEWDGAGVDLETAIPTPAEINRLSSEGKINYRDALALRELIRIKVERGDTLARVGEDELKAFKKQVGIKVEEEESIFDDLPILGGLGGAFGSIGKLFTKAVKYFEKFTETFTKWFEKHFGGEEKTKTQKTFPRSPIEFSGKFTLARATKGVDLKPDGGNGKITAVLDGEVVEANYTSITIKNGDNRVVYSGLRPRETLKKGDKLKGGAELGTLTGDTLNLQILNKNNQQIGHEDLVAYLKPFTNETSAPAPTPTAAVQAPTPATAPAPAPAKKPAVSAKSASKKTNATPAPAPAKKPVVTQKPTESPREQLVKAFNRELQKLDGKTFDIANGELRFNIPYDSGGKIQIVECVFRGDAITIGGVRYRLELPYGAKAKTITFNGTVESGNVTVVGRAMMMEQSKTIPVSKVFDELAKISGDIDSLKTGRASYQIKNVTLRMA